MSAALAASAGSASSGQAELARVGGTVPSWATPARLVGRARGPVQIAVALRWRHSEELSALDQAVSDPRDPGYGHYLSSQEFRARFSPSEPQVEEVAGFLRDAGLRVTGVSASGMLVKATASAGTVERAFHTRLGTYRYRGRELRAPANPISLPADLQGNVAGVLGLDQSLVQPLTVKPPLGYIPARPCSSYWARKVTGFRVPTAYGQQQPWVACGYTPLQMQGAYGVGDLIEGGTNGSGVTVGVVDAFSAPKILKDLNEYSRRHGLAAVSSLTKTVFKPCQRQCEAFNREGWFGEEVLDLDAVHAMAPGADLAYYGGRDSTSMNMLEALARAVDDNDASIITNSYGNIGQSPKYGYLNASLQVQQQAIAQGIGLYFASGDEGDDRFYGRIATEFPSSSPMVTSVGGTSLGVGPLDNHLFELGWSRHRVQENAAGKWNPAPPGAYSDGGGGGTSRQFNQPTYQEGVVPNNLARRYGDPARVAPDVSMDGNPDTGLLVGETQRFPNGTRYGEYRIGGTSLSSPLLAGYMALAEQAAGSRIGFANPAFYALAGTDVYLDLLPAKTNVAIVQNQFLNGINPKDGSVRYLDTLSRRNSSLKVTPGYDNATGLGAPNGALLIAALAGP